MIQASAKQSLRDFSSTLRGAPTLSCVAAVLFCELPTGCITLTDTPIPMVVMRTNLSLSC